MPCASVEDSHPPPTDFRRPSAPRLHWLPWLSDPFRWNLGGCPMIALVSPTVFSGTPRWVFGGPRRLVPHGRPTGPHLDSPPPSSTPRSGSLSPRHWPTPTWPRPTSGSRRTCQPRLREVGGTIRNLSATVPYFPIAFGFALFPLPSKKNEFFLFCAQEPL